MSTRFRLLRYFTLAGLVSFLISGVLLALLQHQEILFFGETQRGQSDFIHKTQQQLSLATDDTGRRNLIVMQEAANVNLARLFANSLWDEHIANFLHDVRSLAPTRCLAACRT